MNFIEIYDDALTKEQCEIIINEFESNTDKQIIGKSGNGKVKPDVKKSIEIGYNIADDSKTTKIIPYVTTTIAIHISSVVSLFYFSSS